MWRIARFFFNMQRPQKPPNTPLSWQMIVAFVLGVPLLMASLIAVAPDDDKVGRRLALTIVGICLPFFLLVVFLEVTQNHGKDSQPDLLAKLIPLDDIFQARDCHFAVMAIQQAAVVRFSVLIQNLRGGAGEFQIRIFPRPVDKCPIDVPVLHCDIAESALAHASIEVPMPELQSAKTIYMRYSASSKTSGRLVRFARRQVVASDLSKLIGLAMAVEAHHAESLVSSTAVRIDLTPAKGWSPAKPVQWNVENLWDPVRPQSDEQLRGALAGWKLEEPKTVSR
jgi:hypothetical protein